MVDPADPFFVVDRATQSRWHVHEWEKKLEEESNKGPRFRVRCLNQLHLQGHETFWRNDFHTVDLEKGKVHLNSLPPIIGRRVSGGDMVTIDSKIYLIGGVSRSTKTSPPPTDLHVFFGLSCLDLSSNSNKWESITQTSYHCSSPYRYTTVSLSGKIYSFGNHTLCPQVYDPNGASKWEELQLCSLPSGVEVDSVISYPVLLDLDNHRILVHLRDSRKIYAFDPHNCKSEWILITDRLEPNCEWETAQAVSDNIIYFYTPYRNTCDSVSAYDITKHKWLTCVWPPTYNDLIFLTSISPCPGTKEIMYLVGGAKTADEPGLFTAFLKFRVKRVDSSSLECNPVSIQTFKFPSASCVVDFLAF